VLGGGLVPGSVTLLGGEPGMGKSTLLLQALGAMAAAGARCLLVTAEESAAQVRLRAGRLGTLDPGLVLVAETSLPAALAHADAVRPDVLAVDSIQAVYDPDAPGVAGSVAQVREGAHRLVRYAKERGVTVLLVGHVTKEGALAGPRALEHVVDTVCSFEGDRHHALRMLRALKHRFGPTDELGVCEMTAAGLEPVPDVSGMFLADRRAHACGSAVAAVLVGARPVLVEVQALTHDSGAPVVRCNAQSLDTSRLAMLVAVIDQRAGVSCRGCDVFASVAGGIRVAEPGVDLAVALAVASARRGVPVDPGTVVLGEVGLGGEIRQVPQTARRLSEAARLGFTRAVVPLSTPAVDGVELVGCPDLAAAIGAALL
jgi:DNA repair protein RadA/Sms